MGELTTLSSAQAEALLTSEKKVLRLNAVTELDPEVAGILVKHNGWLELNGLATLSPEAADALSKYSGELFLGGLKTLSDDAMAAIWENPNIVMPQQFEMPFCKSTWAG